MWYLAAKSNSTKLIDLPCNKDHKNMILPENKFNFAIEF